MSESNDKKFIKGAAILAMAGFLVKIIGAFFRIPLSNMIGAEGMSYYGSAYTIYSVLVVMATAGFPIAISRLVSERIGKRQYRNAHRVYRVAQTMMLAIGLIMFAVCFLGADLIAKAYANPDSALAIRALSPALFFVPLLSATRGYFNGRQNMTPSAVSEITEQLVRFVVGISLAYILLKQFGKVEAAAGAAFGAAAGSIGGLLIILLIYRLSHKAIVKKIEKGDPYVDDKKYLAKTIALIAIPIIIGSEIMPIMNLIDTSLIMHVLQRSGWSLAESQYLYGIYSGFTSPLIGFPQFLTQAVTISLVPAISRNFHSGNMLDAHNTIRIGYRTTMIMAFPCAVGLFSLANPILKLLYFGQPESCDDATITLMIQSIGVIFLAIMQTSTSILQAVGKQNLPVRNLLIGCLCKIVATYLLVGVRAVNVNGAAIGTILAYGIAMALNARAVRKYTNVKIDFGITYIRPLIVSLIMGVGAFGTYHGLALVTNGLADSLKGNALLTLVAIIVAVILYVVLTFAFRVITMEELEEFPKGDKLVKVLGRFVKR